jgi:hypothetical protein
MGAPATIHVQSAASKTRGPIEPQALRQLGWAWVLLCAGLALHITDEALTGFLSVYNPTAREIARRIGFGPPVFSFRVWLAGLIAAVVILLAFSPFAFQNRRAWRPLAWFFAALMLMNSVSHTVGTIRGHSFPDITWPRPMPGFYSSPFMAAAAVWLLHNLRRTRSR